MYPVFDKAVPRPLRSKIDISIHWAKPGGIQIGKPKWLWLLLFPHLSPSLMGEKRRIRVKHMDTHGVAKTQTEASHMQVLVGHPSLATGSDEAVPV